uniref:Uncharacterized protein n=1 Tax=Sarcophilus harrisii TaxID=9305 RepID=A0A7N4PL88_SARHA
MPTDHEEPCGLSHRLFCLNEGICYVIPPVFSLFCRKGHLQRDIWWTPKSTKAEFYPFGSFPQVSCFLALTIGYSFLCWISL